MNFGDPFGLQPCPWDVRCIQPAADAANAAALQVGAFFAELLSLGLPDPSDVAVEMAFFSKNRNAALLNVFVDEVRALARRRRLRVLTFAPSTVKKAVTGNGRASKEQLARVIISEYPELRAYFTEHPQWKQRFHCNMFDAVAVGLTAVGRLNGRT